MNELVDLVVQKTGISQEQAQKAVQVMVDFLKSRLPAPIAAHVDSFMTGGLSGELGALGTVVEEELKGKLGGMFAGGKT